MKKSLLVLVFQLSILCLYAQTIPNGGFETTSDWSGTNISIVSSIPVITKNGKATLYPVTGSKFLLIENTSTSIGTVFNSFPFTSRPDTFSFHLGYMQGNLAERMVVAVLLSKWDADSNKRDEVCQFLIMAPPANGWIVPWTVINIPLATTYSSTEIPDSASILFQNDYYSNATIPTVMVVDDVRFSGQKSSGKTWVGISDQDIVLNQVYYSSNNLYLNYNCSQNSSNAVVTVTNITGQIVFSSILDLKSDVNTEILNLPALNKGIYILSIKTKKGLEFKKFFVN
jgi:hypothetical protein